MTIESPDKTKPKARKTRKKRGLRVGGDEDKRHRYRPGKRLPPAGSGGIRPSDAEVLRRLRVVEQALINGKRGGQLCDELLEQLQVSVPYSTVQSYVQRVRDKWEQEDAMLRPLWRERQLRKLHDIAEKLEAEKAWGHWVSVQKLIADAEGNLAPTKVELSSTDPFDGWSLEELRRFIASDGEEVPERARAGSGAAGVVGQELQAARSLH